MNCEKALDLFSDFFDGRLNQGLQEALERHLAACPSCQAEYEQFGSVVGAIAFPVPPAPPEDLHERIARRLDRIDWERHASKGALPLRVVLPAAAAGLVLLGIVLFNRSGQAPDVVKSGAVTSREVVLQEPFHGTRLLEAGRILLLHGVEGSSYRILEGGTDFSAYPPPDAVEVESGWFKGTGTVARRIEVKSPVGAFIWVQLDSFDDVILLVKPSAARQSRDSTPGADLVTALKALADRHQVAIMVRLQRDGARQVSPVPISGDVIADAKAFADAAGFTHWSSMGSVIRFY